MINLESVVKIKDNRLGEICQDKLRFSPPANENSDLANLFQENNYANEIMIWQFCYSLFTLVCPKTYQKNRGFTLRTSMRDGKILSRTIVCNEEPFRPSQNLTTLLGSCLWENFADAKIKKFDELKNSEWFKSIQPVEF